MTPSAKTIAENVRNSEFVYNMNYMKGKNPENVDGKMSIV